ncbi:hypothetical protein XENOCAPTIV_024820, partial [Xenoophorus captivus]
NTACSTPGKTIITETSLRANMVTGGINAAGTGVATVGSTQLIMAVGWAVNSFISQEKTNWFNFQTFEECLIDYFNSTVPFILTAGGVLSPRVDLDISRLTGTDVRFKSPAQKITASISRHTYIKDAVTEIRCWIHLLVAEAEGAISCLNHLTLGPGRLVIVALWTGRATAITGGIVPRNLPGCPEIICSVDHCSTWGVEVIILISIEVSTKSTHYSSNEDKLDRIKFHIA